MITNTTTKNTYTTTGSATTTYNITFANPESFVVSIKRSGSASYIVLQYQADYEYVYSNEDTETIAGIKLLNETDYASGNSLRIVRNTPLTQQIDFQVGRIDPEMVEREADLSVMRDQELQAKIDIVNETPSDHETRITALEQDVIDLDEEKQDVLTAGTNITISNNTISASSPVTSVNTKTGAVVLDAADVGAIPQYSTMPTASASNLGQIVQYSGLTSSAYTEGYFYQCLASTSSIPALATVTTSGTAGLGTVTCDATTFGSEVSNWADTYSFEFRGYPTVIVIRDDEESTVTLTLTRDPESDADNMYAWTVSSDNSTVWSEEREAEANTMFFSLPQGGTVEYCPDEVTVSSRTTDLDGRWQRDLGDDYYEDVTLSTYGISYNGAALVGAIIQVTYTASSTGNTTYAWEQKNVQPAGGGTTLTDDTTIHYTTDNKLEVLGVKSGTTYDNTLVHKTGTETISGNKTFSALQTNCLTAIPQDINLELSNGTLTLKAGSKVYVPNGSGVFDIVTTTADITATRTSNPTGTCYGFLSQDMTHFYVVQYSRSGTSTSIHASCMYYRTDTNVVYLNNSAGYGNFSFPLCEVTYSSSSSAFTSIDQVFNGFGYIGTSLFALPGVKGLIPNGRNSDGSLNNTEFTTSSVIVSNDSWSGDKSIGLSASGISALAYTYNENDNYVYDESSAVAQRCIVGQISYDTSTTSSQKQVFRAADYSDVTSIADTKVDKGHQVIDFQAPTSDNNYTWYRKYADGWVEQGGIIDHGSSAYDWSESITFPIIMQDTNYIYNATPAQDSGSGCMCGITQSTKNTTSCTFWQSSKTNASGTSRYICWQVSGMYAQ